MSHFPLEVSYEAISVKRFLNETSQTTRLFDGKVLADEETINEFNEALDCALRDVEHANTEGDPQTHMFDLLTCFNAAINAVLHSSRLWWSSAKEASKVSHKGCEGLAG